MKKTMLTNFTVDKSLNTIRVERTFSAPVNLVWSAWTEPQILDQWWAPKPYKTHTKSMDFREGGFWLYNMEGPEGDKHWCRADYKKISTFNSYEALDAFCNEEGELNQDFPRSLWQTNFSAQGDITDVTVLLTYNSLEDLEKIVSLGFKEGFTMALENLDAYIEQQFRLRSELKTTNTTRVTTYLNFPGTTEEAMLFYKSVFGTEFSGKGLQRFGDIPAGPDQPVVSESVKKMILHVELPLLGGHVLMATDAPKEMGFTLTTGNNMHISLEPDSREETQRLFEALSAGGTITMPLEDMFFGAYFGSCTDKYGINWMFNFQHTH